jgi:CRP-like cAMP-binding protein
VTPLDLLRSAPFFEGFSEATLAWLAGHGREVSFEAGEFLFLEGTAADRFFILRSGRIETAFDAAPGASGPPVVIRTIAETGRSIGWSAYVEPAHYRFSARATEPTHALVFDRAIIEAHAFEDPRFAVDVMRRVVWTLGHRVREARFRLIARRYQQEVVAIRTLLAQHQHQLSLGSPLRKIPVYLENRLTLADAVHTLELVHAHGDRVERNLAGLCLDVMERIRRELQVYRQMQVIYERAVMAPAEWDAGRVRRQNCEDFERLLAYVRLVTRGAEHLPPAGRPGHIFILNHLANHPDDCLPNGFWLTIDAHFVSALVCRRYGEPPIRVVREPEPGESAHRHYYDRLGFIYVGTPGSEPRTREESRRRFMEEAARHLTDGGNLVICPEGTSTTTGESPLPFKLGAFKLAAALQPQPLIVPIAVANFDQKLTQATLVAVIHPPFRLSDHVPSGSDDDALAAFAEGLRERYRTLVRAAAAETGADCPGQSSGCGE